MGDCPGGANVRTPMVLHVACHQFAVLRKPGLDYKPGASIKDLRYSPVPTARETRQNVSPAQ